MPRPPRVDHPGAWHHVYCRGNRKQDIFLARADYEVYLACLAEGATRFEWRVHAYTLMPNHVHLILETPQPNLSKGMKRLNETYAMRFNVAHDAVGHAFQGRFGSKPIESNDYLGRLFWYLAMNPVEAQLATAPELYEWSSFAALAGTAPRQPFVVTDVARGLMQGRPRPLRRELAALLPSSTVEGIREAHREGYTVREIAAHLGCSPATVSRRLRETTGSDPVVS